METAVDTLYSKLLANEITPEAMLKQLDTQLTSVLAQQA
jgi:hypothetical protein